MSEHDSVISHDDDIGNNGNWVKEHRSIQEHYIWKCPYLYQLWRFLIMEAKWDDDVYTDGKVKIPLKRGQLVCSLSHLTKSLGTPRTTTKDRLQSVMKSSAIRLETVQGITVITICNYDKYQGTQKPCRHEPVTNPSRTRHGSGPSKELKTKKIKELINFSGAKKLDLRASRIVSKTLGAIRSMLDENSARKKIGEEGWNAIMEKYLTWENVFKDAKKMFDTNQGGVFEGQLKKTVAAFLEEPQ